MELTHASFFSGVGGLDLGLERAGWRTVSFSEIDPYASAVLAERWPGVPNLGDILRLGDDEVQRGNGERRPVQLRDRATVGGNGSRRESGLPDWQHATLWSGGFPCQDLSVAGKRAGFAGERSSLAFAFLDLVEQHRPPAILLENVPGLLSSHGGRDFGALLGAMGKLGYWWAYRILDARHFGVPQRRRRVFIVGLHAERGFGADSAAAVLSVGSRCGRHPATGHATGEGAAGGAVPGVVGTIDAHHGRKWGSDQWSDPGKGFLQLSPSPDPGGNGKTHGMARGLDDLAPTLRVGPARPQDGGPGDTVPIIVGALNGTKAAGGWRAGPDEAAAGQIIASEPRLRASMGNGGRSRTPDMRDMLARDDLLPLGLDSHRYRCCGNGVVSNVSEWIGLRLAEAMA